MDATRARHFTNLCFPRDVHVRHVLNSGKALEHRGAKIAETHANGYGASVHLNDGAIETGCEGRSPRMTSQGFLKQPCLIAGGLKPHAVSIYTKLPWHASRCWTQLHPTNIQFSKPS